MRLKPLDLQNKVTIVLYLRTESMNILIKLVSSKMTSRIIPESKRGPNSMSLQDKDVISRVIGSHKTLNGLIIRFT